MSLHNTADAAERLVMLRQAIQERRAALSKPRSKPASTAPCKFFTRGLCRRSGSCPFSHSLQPFTARPHKLSVLKATRSTLSTESRLQVLNGLLTSYRQQRNQKLASMSYTAAVTADRLPAVPKSMSWVRAGFRPQAKPSKADSGPKPKALIINGIRFRLSNCGRSLIRCPVETDASAPVPQQKQPHLRSRIIPSRVQLNGIDFVKTSTGALVRSSVQGTRRTASQRLKRSLQLVRNKKLDKRKQQLCMFFCRFGFCKLDKLCPFVHDTSKVAICRSFVTIGSCSSPETCMLSHTLDRNKMPECNHFLKGICSKGDYCPYRHVKVSEDAAFCQEFIRGYCSKGEQCKLRHAYNSKRSRPASVPVDPVSESDS